MLDFEQGPDVDHALAAVPAGSARFGHLLDGAGTLGDDRPHFSAADGAADADEHQRASAVAVERRGRRPARPCTQRDATHADRRVATGQPWAMGPIGGLRGHRSARVR